MAKRSYRRFENTFKRQVVEQIESGHITASRAAQEYGLSPSLIVLWRRQYQENGLIDRPSNRERQLEMENEKLKTKIGDLVMEMDHLKKWQAWAQLQRSADTSVVTAKNWEASRKPAK